MVDTVSLDTTAIDTLFDRVFDLLGGNAGTDFLTYVGERVGTLAEGFAREVPERREGVPLPKIYNLNGKRSAFKSRKQQGFVMALVARGKVPRTRTGFLPNSITHAVAVVDTGVVVQVGTNLAGAAYVLDEEKQNRYLSGLGWVSLQRRNREHVDDYRDEVVRTGQAYLTGYIRGRKG